MRFPRLTFPLLLAATVTLIAVPIACVGTNQETASPSAAIIRSGCAESDRGTYIGGLQYAAWLRAAYNCEHPGDASKYYSPIDTQTGTGYGCFCGPGNTGLNTSPADAVDACCKQHDIDLHAICQGTSAPNQPMQGCNCYNVAPGINPLAGYYAICQNGPVLFNMSRPGTLVLPPNLDPCTKLCAEDVIRIARCAQSKVNAPSYTPAHQTPWCNNGPGPRGTPPSYCGQVEPGPLLAPTTGIPNNPPFQPPVGTLGPFPQPRSCY